MVTIRNEETSLNLNAQVASKSVKSMSNTVRQVRVPPAFVLRTIRLVVSGNPEAAAGEEMLQYRYRSTRLCVSISPPKKRHALSPGISSRVTLTHLCLCLCRLCPDSRAMLLPWILCAPSKPEYCPRPHSLGGGRRSRYVFPAVGSLSSKAGEAAEASEEDTVHRRVAHSQDKASPDVPDGPDRGRETGRTWRSDSRWFHFLQEQRSIMIDHDHQCYNRNVKRDRLGQLRYVS